MTQDTSGNQDVHTYFTRAENSHFSGQDVAIVDRWQGRDNLLWRVQAGSQEAVLKLFLEAGQVRSERQFSGQEHFAPLGLAPRPIWQERQPERLPRPILVYEWIEGEVLDLADPFQRDALVEAIVRIHTENPGEYGRFSPHPINLGYFWRVWQSSRGQTQPWFIEREARQLSTLFERLWEQVDLLMEAVLPVFGETPPTLVHGELAVENILLHRGQALLVDWEMYGIGDPAQEVARFLFLSGQRMDGQTQQRWLEHYLMRVGEPDLEQRIEIYRRILAFHSLTFLLNGLRHELTDHPAQIAELAESRQFLVETIAATLLHASHDLLSESLVEKQADLQTEIEQLLSPPPR